MAINSLLKWFLDALEDGEECNALFLDLSRAFDSMCHRSFLQKMECYGFRGVSLELLGSYLQNRKQYVTDGEAASTMRSVTTGVAQGSLLGPLFFIIFTNDFTEGTCTRAILYADDTTILVRGQETEVRASAIEDARNAAAEWFSANRLLLNIDKTAELHVTSSRRERIVPSSARFLGVRFDSRLTWLPHVEELASKLSSAIYAIRRIVQTINKEAARTTYYALFHSRMVYGLMAWGSSRHVPRIFKLQKRAIRVLGGACSMDSARPFFERLGILTIFGEYIKLHLLHTRRNIAAHTTRNQIHDYNTRGRHQLHQPFARLCSTGALGEGVRLYNLLPQSWRDLREVQFKKAIHHHLTVRPVYSLDEFEESLNGLT